MSSLTTHFGIGTETSISELRIYWPSCVIDVVPNPTINTTHNIVEGTFPLSLEDQSLTDISIFPNPAKDILTISTVVDLNQRIATVFDVTGKNISTNVTNRSKEQIDVNGLSNGTYFVQIINNNESLVKRVIVNK